ncbi:hypothetical protein BGX23_009450 [Mortierella sp. AD031]|nr:hypothetical protein BGX23_009450 [Mortierella sp. AD031]
MEEWSDALYEDESMILPAITSVDFASEPRPVMGMSGYGQAKMAPKCVNLKCLKWHGSDSRADTKRARRLGLSEPITYLERDDWFFGTLFGDTPPGPNGGGWTMVDDEEEAGVDGKIPSRGKGWPLPFLDSIDLPYRHIPDLICARLLKRLYRLVNLRSISPILGPLFFQELIQERVPFDAMPLRTTHPHHYSSSPSYALPRRRLCDTVQTLDISGGKMTDDMIFQLLESCPALEVFSAGYVDMSGILERTVDWACLGLKRLNLGIHFASPSDTTSTTTTTTTSITITTATDTSAQLATDETTKELQRAVFSQLGRLHRLKECVLMYCGNEQGTRVLDFKLGHGLELLLTWKAIEFVQVNCNAKQQIVMEDIHWVLEHWPNLKNFIGPFHPDPDINKQVQDALTSRGIKLQRYY